MAVELPALGRRRLLSLISTVWSLPVDEVKPRYMLSLGPGEEGKGMLLAASERLVFSVSLNMEGSG